MKLDMDNETKYDFKMTLKRLSFFSIFLAGLTFIGYKGIEEQKEEAYQLEITNENNNNDITPSIDSITNEVIEKNNINDDSNITEGNNIDDDNDIIEGNNIDDDNDIIEENNITKTNITEENNIDERKIASLTFDDGPGKYTKELVDILNENGAKATFFVVGENVKNYSDAVKYAYDNGNEIGMHTYSNKHVSFTKMDLEEIRTVLVDTYNLLRDIDVEPSMLVRPPFGNITEDIKNNINYSFILWSVDTRDWESLDKDKVKEEILNSISEGSIILMHDIHECSIEAMRELLPTLTKEYKFVTISELFDLLNNDLEINESYRKVKVLK